MKTIIYVNNRRTVKKIKTHLKFFLPQTKALASFLKIPTCHQKELYEMKLQL